MNEAEPIKVISLDVYLNSHDVSQRRPATALEALMSAAPYEEPTQSIEEVQPFREAVAECMEQLNEEDRYIIDAINSERVTLDVLGKRLGVSRMHASRLRDAAFGRLKVIMLTNPLIRQRLGIGNLNDE
jgi:DNA-directed RNA polymerase specialized sigma subunit